MELYFLFFYVALISLGVCQKYNIMEREVQMLSTKHVPQVKLKMCLLKPDVGPCRGNIKMYYFQPEDNTCNSFAWGGCQGNGNRFNTRVECETTCLTAPNEPKKRPRYCELTFDYGFCFGAVKRWYFDRTWKVCKERLYSGCGGNKNNFYNFEQCDSICRLNKGSLNDGSRFRPTGGARQVVYIYTNGTKPPKVSTDMPEYTSPKSRYYYKQMQLYNMSMTRKTTDVTSRKTTFVDNS